MTMPSRAPVPPGGVAGPAAVVPPPSVPLGFMVAAGLGLIVFGMAVTRTAELLVFSPSHPEAVATVHLAVLAFLTVAVLGALHQFGPVSGRSPLRSVLAARLTMTGMVLTAWSLPAGFAFGPRLLIPTAGLLGLATVLLAAWNLSRPLLGRGGGVPVTGLRISVIYLVTTVGFGVVYAFNRHAGWFPLYPARVLAHAHLGLLGWLGLSYVSVAEKLWPMFLLSHRPTARSGVVSVSLIGFGVTPLALGLLLAMPVTASIGGGLVVLGLLAHGVSFVSSVRHRHRGLELLHGFLATSMMFLVVAMVLGGLAAVSGADPGLRSRLVTAEVAALIAWLSLAVIGHAHKIVPFIVYTSLRARGVKDHPSGRPLLFGDLYRKTPARVVLGLSSAGFTALIGGVLLGSVTSVVTAGALLSATGVVTTANLGLGPRIASRPTPPTETRVAPAAASIT